MQPFSDSGVLRQELRETRGAAIPTTRFREFGGVVATCIQTVTFSKPPLSLELFE
jgi:hypothetical protein